MTPNNMFSELRRRLATLVEERDDARRERNAALALLREMTEYTALATSMVNRSLYERARELLAKFPTLSDVEHLDTDTPDPTAT